MLRLLLLKMARIDIIAIAGTSNRIQSHHLHFKGHSNSNRVKLKSAKQIYVTCEHFSSVRRQACKRTSSGSSRDVSILAAVIHTNSHIKPRPTRRGFNWQPAENAKASKATEDRDSKASELFDAWKRRPFAAHSLALVHPSCSRGQASRVRHCDHARQGRYFGWKDCEVRLHSPCHGHLEMASPSASLVQAATAHHQWWWTDAEEDTSCSSNDSFSSFDEEDDEDRELARVELGVNLADAFQVQTRSSSPKTATTSGDRSESLHRKNQSCQELSACQSPRRRVFDASPHSKVYVQQALASPEHEADSNETSTWDDDSGCIETRLRAPMIAFLYAFERLQLVYS
jgi:hypothetical protein